MKAKKILVVGSFNMDMVIKTDHIPKHGETILGKTFLMNLGGKGANQAVAIARLGGNVTFICKIGKDIFGQEFYKQFKKEGIDTSHILVDEETSSGIALITVDNNAENCITVAPGSNMKLSPENLSNAKKVIEEADIILMQLEIPIDTVEYVAKIAKKKNKKVVLNPAPAQNLSEELMKSLYLITPNESEAEIISGQKVTDLKTAMKAAEIIRSKGVDNVIITMGSQGAFVCTDKLCEIISSYKVDAIDTTAAGDIFNGALVVALSEGKDWIDAVKFSCKTSAISVTRMGAQSSAPTRKEVETVCI